VTVGPGAARAGRREWIALGVLTLPCLLYAMDLTVLNLAVPAISKSLRPSGVELLWIVDIYGFVLAGSLITMGALGDRIGRRRLLLAGAAGFAGASVLAAYAASAGMLIAARAAGRGGGDARAVHPVADPQHVPGPGPAQDRCWRVDLQLRGGRGGRAANRRACP
jgi:MFS family permease